MLIQIDLYENENYADIFSEFYLESWFDANAEASAQFQKDLERMNVTAPELVPIMNELFGHIQAYKKEWYKADDAIEEAADNLEDVRKNEALDRVEAYTDYLSRLNEIKKVEVAYDQAVTSAMQTHNSTPRWTFTTEH